MKRRGKYKRCSVEEHRARLRFRFEWGGKRYGVSTQLRNTPDNRAEAEKLAILVGAAIRAGRNPLDLLKPSEHKLVNTPSETRTTLNEYYRMWITNKVPPMERKGQTRDYRRHLEGYVLPRLGSIPLARLTPRDLVGLQAELLARPLSPHALRRLPVNDRCKGTPRTLSVKFVRNIMLGSLRALLRDAAGIDEIPIDPSKLLRGLRWPRGIVLGAEPFEAEQRNRILAWFKTKRFGLHAGRPGAATRKRLHPPYHAYLHVLFWTGARPSEIAGLHWNDVDLDRGTARILRSRHLGEERATKTRAAARTIELMPETIGILRAIQPLNVTPNLSVFTTLQGNPIEPKAFSTHWYHCLRALGLPVRGLYATKDSFVSLAMSRGVDPIWLQEQTGVRFETLKLHYGKWMRSEGANQLEKLGNFAPNFAPGGAGGVQALEVAAEK